MPNREPHSKESEPLLRNGCVVLFEIDGGNEFVVVEARERRWLSVHSGRYWAGEHRHLLLGDVASSRGVDDVEVIAQTAESIVVNADYALLSQVMENLTHNAASRASEVELSVIRAADLVAIQISDNGPGFDEELLPQVFERFRRGDTRGSTGLGMAIAKSIVEAHRGSVSAANRTTGGAIVKLHLLASKDV